MNQLILPVEILSSIFSWLVNDLYKIQLLSKYFNLYMIKNNKFIIKKLFNNIGLNITHNVYNIYKSVNLLKIGIFEKSSNIENIFINYISNNNLDILKCVLMDSRMNKKSSINKVMIFASKNNHFKIVELLLLDSKSRLNSYICVNSALILASGNGHTNTVELLLQDSVIDSSIINIAINMATKNNHFDVVNLLLN